MTKEVKPLRRGTKAKEKPVPPDFSPEALEQALKEFQEKKEQAK